MIAISIRFLLFERSHGMSAIILPNRRRRCAARRCIEYNSTAVGFYVGCHEDGL